LNSEIENYLKPTPVVDCDSVSIREKADEIAGQQKDDIHKAISLFYFVRDNIRYSLYTSKSLPEHYKASRTLEKKEGYCVQKAVLLTALARSAGIPAGVGFARLRNNLMPEKTLNWLGTNILPFHGFSELYLNGKWVKATPAFDLTTCNIARVIPIEFDGKNDAMFHPLNLDGKLHIEYLKHFGRFDDVPLDTLWELVIQHFGRKFLEPSLDTNAF
jgi:hypothetical protein